MPAKSKAQQHLMAAALHGASFPAAKAIRKSMTEAEMRKYAETPTKGKPMHVAHETAAMERRESPAHEARESKAWEKAEHAKMGGTPSKMAGSMEKKSSSYSHDTSCMRHMGGKG